MKPRALPALGVALSLTTLLGCMTKPVDGASSSVDITAVDFEGYAGGASRKVRMFASPTKSQGQQVGSEQTASASSTGPYGTPSLYGYFWSENDVDVSAQAFCIDNDDAYVWVHAEQDTNGGTWNGTDLVSMDGNALSCFSSYSGNWANYQSYCLPSDSPYVKLTATTASAKAACECEVSPEKAEEEPCDAGDEWCQSHLKGQGSCRPIGECPTCVHEVNPCAFFMDGGGTSCGSSRIYVGKNPGVMCDSLGGLGCFDRNGLGISF